MADTALRSTSSITMATSPSLVLGFDMTLPSGRANLLLALKGKIELFNPVEKSAYNALRDELMQVARGQGSVQKIQEYSEQLKRFIEQSAPAPVAVVTPVSAPAPVTQPVEKIEIPPEVQSAPAPVAVATPAVRRRVYGPDLAQAVATPVPAPVTQSEQPVVAEVVAVKDEPAMTATTTANPLSMREEVEEINDELIELGHGRAFQWLNDASTGYKAYMTELLAIRDALTAPTSGEQEVLLRARITALREQANAVRKAVGGEAHDASAPAPAKKERWGASPEETVAALHAEVVADTAVPAPEPNPVPAPASAVPTSLPVESEVSPLPTMKESIPEAPVAPIPEPTPEPLNVPLPPKENLAAVMQETSPVATSTDDALYTPVVDKELNNLLTRWLGSTGFLGFGDSGMKHPEWLVMKDLLVEDTLVDDGTLPPGVRIETYKNLAANVREWCRIYGLIISEVETVDHFIRRVVDASLPKAT